MQSTCSDCVIERSVDIAASPEDVWLALTDPVKVAHWMGGAHVESTWEVGADIAFTGTFHRAPYRDRGTVLAADPPRLLRYSHWSRFSRLPDTPGNRTVMTFNLRRVDGHTQLTVRHEQFSSETAYKHAVFFWSYALTDIKALVER